MSSTPTMHKAYRVGRGVLAAYWLLMFVATHWPELDRYKPDEGWPIPFLNEIMHVVCYAGWMVLWLWVLRVERGGVSRAAVIWLLAGAAAYAIFDELSQALVARQPDPVDFALDMVGLLAGLGLCWLWPSRKHEVGD